MSKVAKILEMHQKHPSLGSRALAEKMGRGFSTKYVTNVLSDFRRGKTAGGSGSTVKKRRPTRAMNRAQFMSKYDEDTRVREAVKMGIATLCEDGPAEDDEIVEDAEFRMERCGGVATGRWRYITDEPEFKPYRFESGGKRFWTTPRTKKWALANVSKAKDV